MPEPLFIDKLNEGAKHGEDPVFDLTIELLKLLKKDNPTPEDAEIAEFIIQIISLNAGRAPYRVQAKLAPSGRIGFIPNYTEDETLVRDKVEAEIYKSFLTFLYAGMPIAWDKETRDAALKWQEKQIQRINRCPECGIWFIGRPDQIYDKKKCRDKASWEAYKDRQAQFEKALDK